MLENKIRPLFGPSLISASLLFSPLAFSIPSFSLPSLTSSATAQKATLATPTAPIQIKGLHSANKIDDEYIVVFHADVSNTTIDKIGHSINSHNQALSRHSRTLSRFNRLKGFAGKIPAGQLKKLLNNPNVKTIEANQIISLSPNALSQNSLINGVDSWALDRLDQASLPLDTVYNPVGTGAGVHAYIIDTGISTSHSGFGGRATTDFTSSDIFEGGHDGNGHGTHLAGLVGSSSYGVASQVSLHSVKVLDSNGSGTLAGLIEGIEYVTNNHQSPAVTTLGFNTSFSTTLNDAVTASINAGVTYTVPGGDYAQDACNYSPGSVAEAITVGSTGSSDNASGAANTGSCLDVYAPGLYVKSTWHSSDNANNTISHSPISAALAAGTAALILGNDPTCNVSQVSDKLLAYSRTDVLTGVPQGTSNQLLAVPTTVESGLSCIDSLPNAVTIDNDLESFSMGAQVEWVGDMSRAFGYGYPTTQWVSQGIRGSAPGEMIYDEYSYGAELVMTSGILDMTFDIGVKHFGFEVHLQGSSATVTITTAKGQTNVIELTDDGFVGFTSVQDIINITIDGADGLTLGMLTRSSNYMDFSHFTDPSDLTNSRVVTINMVDLENHPSKDQWVSSFSSDMLNVSSNPVGVSDVGVASVGSTDFAVSPTTTEVLTSNDSGQGVGEVAQDFTVNFIQPVVALSFNTHLNNAGPVTLTVTGQSGVQKAYTINYDSQEVRFFALLGAEKIQSIRWQGTIKDGVKTGISNIKADIAVLAWLDFFQGMGALQSFAHITEWATTWEDVNLADIGLQDHNMPQKPLGTSTITSLDVSFNGLTHLDFMQGVSKINHDLIVHHNPIKSFSGLSDLTAIDGHMYLSRHYSVTNLHGLESLTFIGEGITIGGLGQLTDISALSNVTSIGTMGPADTRSIRIISNPKLTNLDGLENITTIDHHVHGYSNDLRNVNGLSALTSIGGDLNLGNNVNLSDISGLANLTTIGGNVVLYNTALTHLNDLINLTSIGGYFYLFNNNNLTDLSGLRNLATLGDKLAIIHPDNYTVKPPLGSPFCNAVSETGIGGQILVSYWSGSAHVSVTRAQICQ